MSDVSPDCPEIPYPELPNVWSGLSAKPQIDETAWIASNATVLGQVKIGRLSSVYYGCVLRGDGDRIEIGEETNIQDNSVLHTDHGDPCIIGDRVTVGHCALVHACTVEEDAMIGMGAIVLSKSKIGKGALIAAGSVVKEKTEVPPHTLWAGNPAKQIREIDEKSQIRMSYAYQHYANNAVLYREIDQEKPEE